MRYHMTSALAVTAFVGFAGMAAAQTEPVPPKSATTATKAANQRVQQSLPFNDKSDFEDAQRGFMGAPETLTIKNAAGVTVWDLESYKKFIGLDKTAPDYSRSSTTMSLRL